MICRVALARSPRLEIGAGGLTASGWIATDQDILDISSEADWSRLLRGRNVTALLAEHVLEHMEPDDAQRALGNAWHALARGGYFRIAVPDGYHANPAYIDAVRPGGHGSGSNDHRVLYNHETLALMLTRTGFRVALLEWYDRQGQFHQAEWDPGNGLVRRSLRFDPRNRDGRPNYTSLIVDAFKP